MKKIFERFNVAILGSLLLLISQSAASQNFYVNDNSTAGDEFTSAVGSDANPGTSAQPFATIQHAINTATAGSSIFIDAGTYNQQAIVNKQVGLYGAAALTSIIDLTGAVSGRPALLDVTANNVTIENLYFNVDMSKLRSAVLASSAGLDNIIITNNRVNPYGTPGGSYGDRNAFSINYGGSTNYRVASGGVNNISFTLNQVFAQPTSAFRAAIAADEAGGTFTGNTLQTINHDIIVRFGNNGNITISGNNFLGGGVELDDMNAGAGTLTVSNNSFDATVANVLAPNTAVLRLQNNYQTKTTNVLNNNFSNHEWAVSLANYNAVTLSGNTFTPLAGSTGYHHVVVNSKAITTTSATIVQVPLGATFTNNTFNGSGSLGGTALAFLNHDSDNDSYGTFNIGTAGNENNFNANIASTIFLDGQTGSTVGATWPPYHPPHSPNLIGNSANSITTMACWSTDLNVQNNRFDVGAGLQLPSAMSAPQRTALEGTITHKPDNACLGTVTAALAVHNLTQNTYHATIQSAVTAAVANDVIEVAEGVFNEKVIINKTLTLQGVSETGCIIDGTGLGNGSGIHINNNIQNVVIKRFTIQNHSGTNPNSNAGIHASSQNNGIQVEDCTIKNNVGGSGFYANGPINGVLLNNLDISGHPATNGAARGIVIWNGFKQNITITNCDVYNNNCCGIELQDGTSSGVTMTGNNVYNNGDNGMGIVGMQGPGANLISNNTLSNNGRFGMEIKNPNGSGAAAGPGSIVVTNNSVTMPGAIADLRDMVGIGVFRRGVLAGNVDVPTGVVVSNNIVTGYTQPSVSEGFGIVIEGMNHTVTGNTVSGNDVGIQRQAGHLPYPGDGNQNNVADTYFGRGNSQVTCGVTITGNTVSNAIDYRDVGGVSTGAGIVTNTTSGESFCTIQSAINDAQTLAGHTLQVSAGTFEEDVLVNKAVILSGAGESLTTISGIIGGDGATVRISASNAEVSGFSITRNGNNTTDWNNPGLNSTGIAIQGLAVTGVLIHDNNIFGNRTGIDINNSNGHTMRNNVISNNRTGLIFRNQTDNMTFTENSVNGNWTVGILFLDASGGTNVPVQTAANSNFNNNDLSGNWYGQVVDRQVGGALPPAGSNLKNFSCNWWGAAPPSVSTANSAEPGYAAQIPVAYGGDAEPPVTAQPDILGGASANIVYVPYLSTGTDANVETAPGRGTYGFQPSEVCVATCSLVISTSSTDATCPLMNNGTATVTVESGGVNPSFSWNTDPVQTTATATGLVPGAYTVTVTDVNGCNAQEEVIVALGAGSPPAAPAIDGPTNVCTYVGTMVPVQFTVVADPNITTYNWVVPPTVSIVSGQNTPTLTVTFSAGFTAAANKQIRLTVASSCGVSPMSIKYLLAQRPSTPGSITGPVDVCNLVGAGTAVYSIDAVTAASSYLWSVPAGVTIVNNNGSNIEVSFDNSFVTSSITVSAVNTCGASTARSLLVKRVNPSMPGLISGPTNVCMYMPSSANPAGVPAVYTVSRSANVSSYIWTVPAGAVIADQTSTMTEDILTVNFSGSYTTGNISVVASGSCGNSTPRTLALNVLNPGTPGAIDVVQVQACPDRQYSYSISTMPANANYVTWTVPVDGTIVSGQGTITVVVSYPVTAVSGIVTAIASNGCGSSGSRKTTVKLPGCPEPEERQSVKGFSTGVEVEVMEAGIFPNPSTSEFRLKLNTTSKAKAQARVFDAAGRPFGTMTVNPGETITFGANLKAGTYFVEVIQGGERRVVRVVKL